MAKDLLTTYKLGWKTSYYQNTYDGKNDNDEPQHSIGGPENEMKTRSEFDTQEAYDEYCESCAI
jgi:ribonucleoside-diphosphate reductase alpha chain